MFAELGLGPKKKSVKEDGEGQAPLELLSKVCSLTNTKALFVLTFRIHTFAVSPCCPRQGNERGTCNGSGTTRV